MLTIRGRVHRRLPLLAGLLLAGCQQAGRQPVIVMPEETLSRVAWTAAEQARDVAVRPLRAAPSASYHLILLNTAEKPHRHNRHDLIVTVLSGRVNMHLGQRVVEVRPGDVIDIPRGVPHWAENLYHGPSEALAVFSPAFDGRDAVPVEGP